MAINALQIPQNTINSQVDQSQWSTLGNLGNVYRAAQEEEAKQSALSKLGSDPAANAQILLTSHVPSLAQLGLSYQQKALEQQREDAQNAITNARANAYLGIAQHGDRRSQETADQADADRVQAADLLKRLSTGETPAAAAPSPFPAPLPGPQSSVAPPQPGPQATAEPSAFGASPPVPATLTATATPPGGPPVMAAGGDEPTVPDWAQNSASLTARATASLVSPNPPAATGINRELLGALVSNPNTRALGIALLQKQLDPGAWSYHFDDTNGRVIATHNRTNEVKDVTPGGGDPISKQQREVQGYLKTAREDLGLNDDQAKAYAANKGKMPSEDLHPDERKAIGELTKDANNGKAVIANIDDLSKLSKTAWGHPGALEQAKYIAGYTPEAITPQGAIDTMNLANAARTNVATMAKSIFGSRLAVAEVKLLDELEGSANQPDAVRQPIFARAKAMLQTKVNDAQAEAEGIRNKTFYKPGGGTPPPTATAPPPPEAAATAKPSLGEFMTKARAANPGFTDSELAQEWKKRYGN